ncbi:Dicer-like protein 1 [Trametes pubescens]|uniref:Dicer-like protein 1 n=1 Tax=Trametes pubescens TaxID=154538 RepID=A0A1M2W0V3_TRAPU|nr:Dicer-like protein 1 [Trametes pubescens]
MSRQVTLIVFDECHHTRKNHAYNGIMREYFQTPAGSRPKIFGMTASPIWNPKNAAESLATLERNLDAKVIAVKEHIDELSGHSPKPTEVHLNLIVSSTVLIKYQIIQVYPAPPIKYPDYPSKSLRRLLNLEDTPAEIGIPVDKILTRYEVTFYSLGPFGAELFLYTEVKQRVSQMIQDALDSSMDYLTPAQYAQTARAGPLSPDTLKNVPQKLKELHRTLESFRDFFETPESGSDPMPIPMSWCSPKVRKLAETLFERYTDSFQGIIFVEQRHVATCLAVILERIPLLAHVIKSEQLVGHGKDAAKAHTKGMGTRNQQDTVKMFRERAINVLVATSVAEEGLDFPACDLVIRFDPVQHMVGYVQSRGRARHKTSTFIIMLQEGAQSQAERYLQFSQSEPHLKQVYQERDFALKAIVEEEEDTHDDPEDLAERERYVVPSTGAVLTYTSAIGLLNHLCSLIPRDKFTPMHVPTYTGDVIATVHLPSSLPLPADLLVYEGPPRRSKKEAKRAAAFLAVKSLHALNVFDDYLLPTKSARGRENEDSDGVPIGDVAKVPDVLDVRVRDPWVQGRTLWLHVVYVDGRPSAGVVTGTPLPPVELVASDLFVSTDEPREVVLHPRHAWSQRRAMEDYTRMGLWWCITGRGITLPLTCYLVPIDRDLKIDFEAIDLAVRHLFGSYNWEGVGEEHYGHLMYVNNKEAGHPMILHKLRPDITPSMRPPEGSRESAFPTYRDFWIHKYTRKGFVPIISKTGPCVEGVVIERNASSSYSLENGVDPASPRQNPATVIFPLEICRWALMPEHIYRTFFILPELCHRATDVWRAREARVALKLPPIADDLLVQALTLPSTNAQFNNQRLETLGDAVLKLSAVVHLYNRYPHRHEGQLDAMKRVSVANRTLLARGVERSLERHLSSEPQSMRMWRYVISSEDDLFSAHPSRHAPRRFPRKSMQDCMEALLGASFATGGIDMALHAGTVLGVSFGGPTPWNIRYGLRMPKSEPSPLFLTLQEALGYRFDHGQLLLEAVTHPSFGSVDSSSYQRLEFLGDALIDMVVTEYLYKKFPEATSGQLSWARSRAVCGTALASLAVNRLGLHKLLLINNVELSIAISRYVPILEEISNEEIILDGWKHDPPKALSDVFESVMGALFVDCDYNYDKAAAVIEMVMDDLIDALRPDLPRDPVSQLMVWVAKAGCRCVSFAKSQSRPELRRHDCMSVLVHDVVVVGPVPAPNVSMAKGLAAEEARRVLDDPESPHHLSRVCVCAEEKAAAEAAKDKLDVDKMQLDDETTEGFATLARILLDEVEESGRPPALDPVDDAMDGDIDEGDLPAMEDETVEEMEVKEMMEVDA